MKKIKLLVLLLIILIAGNSFAYSKSQLQHNIEKRLIKIENKIYKYTKSVEKFCKLSDNFYKKLIKKVNLYQNKYPKYKQIYNAIILVSKKRQVILNNKCNIYFKQNKNIDNTIKENNNTKKPTNNTLKQ